MELKQLLNVQWSPMSLEKVWQTNLRQFWRCERPRVNPKDGFEFNEILWLFLDQCRRWGQELQRVVLGTGRLTIARAIGQFFLGGGGGVDKVCEDELRKFSEEKKKEYCRD